MKKKLQNKAGSVEVESKKVTRVGEQPSNDIAKSASTTSVADKNRDKPKKEPWMSLGRAVKEVQTEQMMQKKASSNPEGAMKALDSVSKQMDAETEADVRARARKRAAGK